MKEFGLQAVVLEPGPAMQYLTGVRWGRSERTFAVVFTQKGDPAYVLPGFEEMRARELIEEDVSTVVAVCDKAGNLLSGVRLQLRLGYTCD